MSYYGEKEFVGAVKELQRNIYDLALRNGFWEEDCGEHTAVTKLALVHAEISEALEAWRKPEAKDKHLPDIDARAVELADAVIRIFDLCTRYNLPIAEAILAKHKYNLTRPYKHGKKF